MVSVLSINRYYLIPGDPAFIEVPNTADFNNVSTNAILDIINPIAYLDYQFYCQVRENTSTCFAASNAVKLETETAIWSSSAWSSIPDSGKIVIIDDDYDTGNSIAEPTEISFEACQLIVNAGHELIIRNDDYVLVENNLTVNGSIVVDIHGSFVQVNDLGIVDGDVLTTRDKVSVRKETAPLATYQEYTYWSSPVSGETIGQGLFEASPTRRFLFNAQMYEDRCAESLNDDVLICDDGMGGTLQDDIDDNNNDWEQVSNNATVMTPGIGYAATHNGTGFSPSQFIYIF